MSCSVPGTRKIPWRRAAATTQYSSLETPVDRGTLHAMVREVTKSQTNRSTLAHAVDQNLSLCCTLYYIPSCALEFSSCKGFV